MEGAFEANIGRKGDSMRNRQQKAEATAEVFWTAFSALPKAERSAVFRRFAADKQFREDLLDLAVFEERRQEA